MTYIVPSGRRLEIRGAKAAPNSTDPCVDGVEQADSGADGGEISDRVGRLIEDLGHHEEHQQRFERLEHEIGQGPPERRPPETAVAHQVLEPIDEGIPERLSRPPDAVLAPVEGPTRTLPISGTSSH